MNKIKTITAAVALAVFSSAPMASTNMDTIEPIQMTSEDLSIADYDDQNAVSGFNDVEQSIIDRISTLAPDSSVTHISESPVPGLYTVVIDDSEVIYMSSNSRIFISGDMMEISTVGVKNLTEERRSTNRMKLLSEFQKNGVISYNAPNEKIRLSVFTDIDCPYCRKLHENMDEYLSAGISIDYYAYPRSGPETSSFTKYVATWCADDQKKAMDFVMSGGNIGSNDCENPVEQQFRLGEKIGITGTPSFISLDGQVVPGLLPPQALLRQFGL